MRADEVRALVESAIGDDWSVSNAHGVDLRTCLVQPVLGTYPEDGGGEIDLWLVLEEDPVSHGGYKIVFDEAHDRFGLATRLQGGGDLYLGAYGDFMTTLDAM